MKNGGLTAENVEAKLREFGGNMAAVGRHFGVTRQAVYDFVRRRKSLRAVVDDARESFKDNAESALQAAVLRGEAWAVCFYLKCQAKDRGYVERSELDVRNLDALIERELARLAAGGQGADAGAPAGNAPGAALPDAGP